MRKTISMLSLGGTISMTEASSGGLVSTLSGEDLIQCFGIEIPSTELVITSLRQLASAQLTVADLIAVATKTHELADQGVAGIVITQGTDTIEETAFALDILGTRKVPIVVTGAMRHPTAPGSDGPANLRDAIMVAAHGDLGKLGTVVVMDGEIHAARFVIKSKTSNVHAFRSAPIGRLGWVQEGSVYLATAQLRSEHSPIALPSHSLPDVAVLKASLGDDGRIADKLVELGYSAAIVEGVGGGHVHPAMAERLEALSAKIPIVISTRVVGSHVLRKTYGYVGSEIDLVRRGMMLGGWLTTGKLHLLLTFLLANRADKTRIKNFLEQFGGG